MRIRDGESIRHAPLPLKEAQQEVGANEPAWLASLGAKQVHADRMGSAELIANVFVRSQTEQTIRNEPIGATDRIIQAPYEVGAETRGVIQRTGGALPEDLPAKQSIRPLLDQRARARRSYLRAQDGPSLFEALPAPEQADD
jgi:hypothetical protein